LLEELTFTESDQGAATRLGGVEKDKLLKQHQEEIEDQRKRIFELEKVKVGGTGNNEVGFFFFFLSLPLFVDPNILIVFWSYLFHCCRVHISGALLRLLRGWSGRTWWTVPCCPAQSLHGRCDLHC